MTTQEHVKALEAVGFKNRGNGVWGADAECYFEVFTLFLSPTGKGNDYVVWWQEWLHCGQEGEDVGCGTFKEMAALAVATKQLADAGEWGELGFEYCGDLPYDEADLREDVKADVMREEPAEQMSLL